MDVQKAKSFLTDYVNKITIPSVKAGKNAYVCPLCKSGTKKNGTGGFFIYNNGTKWKCHACDKGGDIFDLVGEVEGIPSEAGRFQRIEEIYGLGDGINPSQDKKERKHIHNNMYITIPKAQPESNSGITTEASSEKDYTSFFEEANKHLNDTTYHRGISEATLNRFKVGYVKDWVYPDKKGFPSPRLIIPTGKDSYVARSTNVNEKDHKVLKVGKSNLFNVSALDNPASKPVFIVEGEIDALSIIDMGFPAVGLGSAGNYRRLLLHLANKTTPCPYIIIALDSDEAGQKHSALLEKGLEALKIPHKAFNVWDVAKDPNGALEENRGVFLDILRYMYQYPEEEKEAYKKHLAHEKASVRLQKLISTSQSSQHYECIPTGFTGLDRLLDGGLYAGLYIIGAISSLGKTTFCLQLADQIAASGRDVLVFSLEMSAEELIGKSVSRQTYMDVKSSGLDTGLAKTARGILAVKRYDNYSQAEKDVITQAENKYTAGAGGNISIIESMGEIGAEEIRVRVEDHIKYTGKLPIVLIDYLQILKPYDIRATDKQNTDRAVTDLKRVSRDFAIPVIGISSFNRDNYTSPVNLSSFKESGAIEYSSDVLIGLQYNGMDYDDTEDKGEAEGSRTKRTRKLMKQILEQEKQGNPRPIQLKVLKNRNGERGDAFFKYYALFNYFEECSKTDLDYMEQGFISLPEPTKEEETSNLWN